LCDCYAEIAAVVNVALVCSNEDAAHEEAVSDATVAAVVVLEVGPKPSRDLETDLVRVCYVATSWICDQSLPRREVDADVSLPLVARIKTSPREIEC